MFYCDPVFAFVGMRQLLKYKHLLARRATCAVYGRFFCHLKGTKCIHISNVQLPCSYCIHGATCTWWWGSNIGKIGGSTHYGWRTISEHGRPIIGYPWLVMVAPNDLIVSG